ncbi:hypothetical protein [Capnocytophaga sp.]|uniref:RipA family octameric membrane protein n=1 Tax=Capnocytophaga sp. TaxID=44737 RepID=UPI0026DCD85A|nr:hypothetical protein [Capnocytophaga sp.]MDO5105053.1 hypothetical protein [Capnocytophaga sp.]
MIKRGLESKERYDYLIKARNFHYENFNKWISYFYIAIGALFVGYYTILPHKEMDTEKTIVLVLGYTTSLFLYWSSKGYYFWNINFIMLINDCEENTLNLDNEDRVYFVFANKKIQNNYLKPHTGANISTSKIAIFFSFVITLAWGVLLMKAIYSELNLFCNLVSVVLVTLFLSYIVPKNFLKSKISHFPDLKIKQHRKK